jgi:hypothetical protein
VTKLLAKLPLWQKVAHKFSEELVGKKQALP